MSIMPYRTLENLIDGVVATFVEITGLKLIENESAGTRIMAESVMENIPTPFLLLNIGLKAIKANRAFLNMFDMIPDDIINQRIYDLAKRTWDLPEMRKLLEEIIPEAKAINRYKVAYEPNNGNTRDIYISARKISQEGGRPDMILLLFEEAAQ
jgi:two-component system, chemotaxis family, CheB/CheR fusion protein